MNGRSQYICILNGIFLMLISGVLAGTLLQNVAQLKEAVQSSQAFNTPDASAAVDGNIDVRFHKGSCISTQVESDPWWRVDLQGVYKINALTITQRDLSESMLTGAEIWIGISTEVNVAGSVRCALLGNIPDGLTFHLSFNAIEGQYVTLRLPGMQKTLTFCEIEVFDVDFAHPVPNVALKGVATQSSTLWYAVAPRANDGRRNSFYNAGFCSHTAGNETDPWWRLDLQQTYIITSVKVTNRGDCCAERLDGAEIRIGNSLENNGNDNPRCASISHIRAGKTNTYHCNGGSMDGRFVNVIIPGEGKTLALCEVEVYGTPTVEPVFNVALRKPTAQSWSWSIFGGAHHAVSGCRSGKYWGLCCSETSPWFNPWWRVDLLAEHKVDAVTILNRRAWLIDTFLTDAEVRIGNSLEHDGTRNPRCGTIHSTHGTYTFTFQCDGMEGRYLVVIIPRLAVVTLCEVEVFATLLGVPVIPPTAPPPSESSQLNGRSVTLVEMRLCWSEALFFCRRHHWDLLSIRNQAEQSAVEQLLSSAALELTSHVWLGLRRYVTPLSTWFWMSGDAMRFTKWPRDTAPNQYAQPCGGMARGAPAEWGDRPCDEPLNFICQSGAEWGSQRVNYESTDELMPPEL